MIRYFRFADICIEVTMPDDILMPDNMMLFLCDHTDKVDHYYKISFMKSVSEVEHLQNGERFDRNFMTVFRQGDRETRWIYYGGADEPYAVAEEISDTETRIYVMETQKELLIYDTIFVSFFSLEKLMMRHDALVLHSAYIGKDGQAVLFSAPSGTGKSTQADLWEKYRNTRTVNGDASLLCKKDGIWRAFGWPICGSSQICHNETYPIEAIVMLYQAPDNVCRKLRPMEVLRKLYPQIKVNMWNEAYQNKAFDLLEDLMQQIPILELGCNISEDAVRCLEDFLQKEVGA